MSAWRSVVAVLSADLRQRMRTPHLWLLIIGLAALMWWCFPAADKDYLTVSVGDGMRGRYSSAWIGMMVALMYSTLLSLAGFYLVRGTVARDLETRTWQLLVATTMSRSGYLLAKWLSHLVLFLLVLTAGLAVGLVIQWLRAEDSHIDLVELVKPVLLLSLPSLALTASLAVWFDLVPWLRRSAGNVLFFVLWVALLMLGISQAPHAPGAALAWPGDPLGLVLAEHDLTQAWSVLGASGKLGLSIGTQTLVGGAPVLLDWTHWALDADALRMRGFWVVLALAVLGLAVPILDRCAAHVGRSGRAPSAGSRLRWLDVVLSPLKRTPFGALMAAELRLVLRQRRSWWWLVLLGTMPVQAFAPAKSMAIAVIVAWMLVLDVFSRLVLREHETGTLPLVFSAPAIRARLLTVRALVGIGLAWMLTMPAMLRMAALNPQAATAMLVVGVSLTLWGLALGSVCRNGRLFELLILAAAYVSVQGAWVLNVVIAPMTTLRWHLFALPLALGVMVLGWRRITATR